MAVGEGEVGAARMAAAERAGSVEVLENISIRRHLVVDRRGHVEVDPHRPVVRNETPHPRLADTTSSRPNNGLEEVVMRIPMIALAEKERVTRAVFDGVNAN